MAKRISHRPAGISRREFIRYSVGTAALLSAGSLLSSCASSGSSAAKGYEPRSYLFNLHHIDFSNHDLILVMGAKEYPLQAITREVFAEVAQSHPFLNVIGQQYVSHHVYKVDMPKGRHQTCYIRKIHRITGEITIPFIFTHFPKVADLDLARYGMHTKPHMRVKWKRYGIDSSRINGLLFDDNFKDSTDHACQLVNAFPQITSLDSSSAAAINTGIIGNQDSTYDLSDSLSRQGDAWATNQPLMDPVTGKQCVDNNKKPMFTQQWSDTTSKNAGKAIQDSNNDLQNNGSFGVNTTNVNQGDASLRGKTWDYSEGVTYRNQSGGLGMLQTNNTFNFTTSTSSGFRYHLEVENVDANRNITFKIKNTGSRYLIGGVAYKDANGNLMTYSQIGSSFFKQSGFSTSVDYSADQTGFPLPGIIGPELKLLAIPIKGADAEFTVPTPKAAETIVLLGGGPGSTDSYFPVVSAGGWALTAMMCWTVPTICTVMDAAEAYEGIVEGFTHQPGFQTLIINALYDTFIAASFTDTDALKEMAVQTGEWLLTARFATFLGWLSEQMASVSLFNAFPIVGQVAEAIGAAADAASIAESMYDTANAPIIYQSKLVVSHTITLTITHDPNNTSGFPATTSYFTATLQISNAIPIFSDKQTVSNLHAQTITQTFNAVPVGGTVTITVAFYGADGCMVGQGTVTGDNSSANNLALGITIKELLHPLTSQTHYIHKEKIILDASGNHVWQVTSTPPAQQAPTGCTYQAGQICDYGGMTVSNSFASLGYTWRGYKTAQQWQAATISIGDSGMPQSGYNVSPASDNKQSVSFSLLGDQNINYYADGAGHLRQVRLQLNGLPQFDSPTSNRSWGKLQFRSDDLLLHPEGKVVSVNTDLSKVEVICLPSNWVADKDAKLSSAYGGLGSRPGLLNSPTLCALTAKGELLILESGLNQVSSYDIEMNPVPTFGTAKYSFQLRSSGVSYLDMAVEHAGYLYILYSKSNVIMLDIYDPSGKFVSSTSGVNAAKICVTLWREVYTMNYEPQRLPNGNYPALAEPTISHWIPFGGCGQSAVAASSALQSCRDSSPGLKARLKDIVNSLAVRLS